ncbi:MAG: glycoside hydrolase family 16 protein [Chloroflexi bacterium]|nr:glycoside hydrolase family 16 protein [Chloroflexota bacterium]
MHLRFFYRRKYWFLVIRSTLLGILLVILVTGARSALGEILPDGPQADQPQKSTASQPVPNLVQDQDTQWKLIFNSQFSQGKLDPNQWVTCYWWDNQGCTNSANNELEWYLPANVQVGHQGLNLVAQKQTVQGSDNHTYRYTSGMVTTGRSSDQLSQPVKFAFQYGFTEVRAKIPKGRGLWSAFWLLPANNDSIPEIDVMEIVGSQPNTVVMTLHYLLPNGVRSDAQKIWTSKVDLSQGWHTYAVDWEPDFIAWYIDGVETWKYTDTSHIPNQPMYLLLNLAVGGTLGGTPGPETVFPSTFSIQYIRVWQHASAPSMQSLAGR